MEGLRRRLSRRIALLLAAAFVVGIGLGVGLWALTRDEEPEAARNAATVPHQPVAAAPEPAPRKAAPRKRPRKRPRRTVRIDANAADPVSVSVPGFGISAPIIALSLQPDGKLESPKRYSDAGWRRGGPEPGERGAAVIAGHVDSKSGPAAFYRLREVGPGAEIEVRRADGSTVTFVAQRREQVPKDAFPTGRVYGETRLPTLRLVTCGGEFSDSSGHYSDNVIVYATRKPT